MSSWTLVFENLHQSNGCDDASHDISHLRRVHGMCHCIASKVDVDVDHEVLTAAAYLHDIDALEKDSPLRKEASRFAAEKANGILKNLGFPEEKIPLVYHAIETHSFSANKTPETIEAKILQDADRMDSIGMLGVMRTFYVGGRLNRKAYDLNDPLAKNRELDDQCFSLDHFEKKLLKLTAIMQLDISRRIAKRREETILKFREGLVNTLGEGTDSPTRIFADLCNLAGKEKKVLLHSDDPFAMTRNLDEENIALDAFLQLCPSSEYIQYLKEELIL